MKPVNRADRNNAFLGFLLLFGLTIGIILAVIFFSIKVPFRDNERLKTRILTLESEKNFSDSFKVAMSAALSEMERFDLKKEGASYINSQVQVKIAKMGRLMKNMPLEETNGGRSIYELVLRNLADLNDAKTKIRNLEEQRN